MSSRMPFARTVSAWKISQINSIIGIKYDQEGNLKAWLDKETTRRYKDRAECFIRQYDKAAGPKNQRRGGQFFLSENLADNIGLKLAYKAYKLWQNDAGEVEPSLPGFQNYTNERMFFISYTNVIQF